MHCRRGGGGAESVPPEPVPAGPSPAAPSLGGVQSSGRSRVRSTVTCGESAPSSNQRSRSHSHQASWSSPANTSRHWRPFVTSARWSPPARSQPSTWLTMRRPLPTPRRLPPSRNTGRRAPRWPVHRWRGLTVSPVTARLPSAGATLLPRAHVPVEASKPQTCSSTNATKDDAPLPPTPLSPRSPLPAPAPSSIAPARWRSFPSV